MKLRTIILAATLTATGPTVMAAAPTADKVLGTYADIASAMYEDSLAAAKTLQKDVAALIAKPTDASLSRARASWIAARVPYQQTEGFRFGNKIVDDWEGKVNAWPLDEGLIDYVDPGYGDTSDENPLYTLNVIAHPKIRIGREEVDAAKITKKTLLKLHEAGEVESNVATGYHAIEFLLWGQDLNGIGPGAGNRPASDYDTKACTHGNCDRRAQYLKAATDLLVDDLAEMVAAWKKGSEARKELRAAGPSAIFTGLGSLSYGELAGERTKLGLMLHDPEEEHDCFSDNTHNSHYYNVVGMRAIWTGSYRRAAGPDMKGVSPFDLASAKSPEAAARLSKAMDLTVAKAQVMKDKAEKGGMAYDQMLAEGNAEGEKVLTEFIDTLVAQTRAIEAVVAALDLKASVEGSDSLDQPEKVGK